jgi:hypothetical protein
MPRPRCLGIPLNARDNRNSVWVTKLSIPELGSYNVKRLDNSDLYIAVSSLRRPEPFRSKRFVVMAEAEGIRSKIFSLGFDKSELGFSISLDYFNFRQALLGRYVNRMPFGESAPLDMKAGGTTSSRGFKLSHHADGRVHFSQDGKIYTRVVTQSKPLVTTLGHVFTVYFQCLDSFAPATAKDDKEPSKDRTAFTFRYDDKNASGKIIGRWYPIRAIEISELGPGLPWEPKVVHLIGDDGEPITGFLLAPPKGWNWTEHCLLLSYDTRNAPETMGNPYLLVQGGFFNEVDDEGRDAGGSFIGAYFTDRSEDFSALVNELGSVDYP